MSLWSQILASLIVGWLCGQTAAIAEGREPVSPIPRDSIQLAHWLDRRFETDCADAGVNLPRVVDDSTYVRRAYLDLVGTIPTVSELRDFLAESSTTKRRKLIERLVVDPQLPVHLSRVWRRVLVPGQGAAATSTAPLEDWLRDQFAQNVPYDLLARQLVTAGGATAVPAAQQDPSRNGPSMTSPVSYLIATGGQPASMASSVSRVFLGIRLSCAQCHDHPFADWTQEDFWGMAAFFAGSRLQRRRVAGQDNQSEAALIDERTAKITPLSGGPTYHARFLWGEDTAVTIPDEKLPRQVFSEWLTSSDNPHFASTAVNRIWQYLCGRGLTESVDHLDQANDEERDLLDDLATLYALNDFDTRWLIQGICNSKFYQRPSVASEGPSRDLTHRPLKVLVPEQLYSALEVSLALPISRIDQGPRYNGQRDQLIARMSEALGDNPEDFRNGIPQALILMNGRLTAEATDLERSRTLRGVINAPFLQPAAKIETLFMATLSRRPRANELDEFMRFVKSQSSEVPTRKSCGR